MKFYMINGVKGKWFQKTIKKHNIGDYVYINVANENIKQGFKITDKHKEGKTIFYKVEPIKLEIK